jgi:transketolase
MDIRDAFFNQLYEIAKSNPNVIVLTADMGVNEFARFRELRGQFYNVGISEQNMVNMAQGLALQGKKVYVYTIAVFLQRAFEQIKLACQMNLPITFIGGCVGLSNSTDGFTHYCINDITCMRTLPNLTILNPSYDYFAQLSAKQSYESKTPLYVRLDKGNFRAERSNVSGFGADLIIIATGNMVDNALQVAKELKQILDIGVWDLFQLQPLNLPFIEDILKETKRIITLEEHLNCGLGSIISEFLTDNNLHIPLKRLGVSKTSPIGSREYMQKLNGLDVEGIKNAIR